MSRNTLKWLHGLGAALIGGGAGAVSTIFGVNLVDPKDWNVQDWPHAKHMLFLMVIVFTIQGAVAAFAWLSKDPLPSLDDATPATVKTETANIPKP